MSDNPHDQTLFLLFSLRNKMKKIRFYLLVLLLASFVFGSDAEALDIYVSPALLIGINFDESMDKRIFSLSSQVTVGLVNSDFFYDVARTASITFGRQLSWNHNKNRTYFDLQFAISPLAGAGVGWSWQSQIKKGSIRGKIFWPFAFIPGIEYDQNLKIYFGAALPIPVLALISDL